MKRQMRNVYHVALSILIALYLTVSAHAATLHLFEPALTTDEFPSEEQELSVPPDVPNGWYPLRKAAEYLPFTIDWDSAERAIVIDSDATRMLRPYTATQRYKPSRIRAMADDLKIVNGVAYCSPRFIVQHLGGIGFVHDGEVWCCTGAGDAETYIDGGDSPRFTLLMSTTLCRLYLAAYEDYTFVRANLSGGIRYVPPEETDCCDALGYVYPVDEPVCYLVGDRYYGATLASFVSHEAMHIAMYRQGITDSEDAAEQYEQDVLYRLLADSIDQGR